MKPEIIYELVDASGDEYYTLGLFHEINEAIESATQGNYPPTEAFDGSAKLEVRSRTVDFTGYGNIGKVIAVVDWIEEHDEKSDEWKWNYKIERI